MDKAAISVASSGYAKVPCDLSCCSCTGLSRAHYAAHHPPPYFARGCDRSIHLSVPKTVAQAKSLFLFMGCVSHPLLIRTNVGRGCVPTDDWPPNLPRSRGSSDGPCQPEAGRADGY